MDPCPLINSERTVWPEREVMTVAEAADFLRFSRSTMHQRRDIPQHSVPGSRQKRYLRSELLAWLKGEFTGKSGSEKPELPSLGHVAPSSIDIGNGPVYHRNGRYR